MCVVIECACIARQIFVAEGLHPFYDERVRELMDFKIYLDISDEVKFAWKIQRDMAERGHSLESIKASIEARKPDFDAYIDTQKKYADVIIQARCTQHRLPLSLHSDEQCNTDCFSVTLPNVIRYLMSFVLEARGCSGWANRLPKWNLLPPRQHTRRA